MKEWIEILRSIAEFSQEPIENAFKEFIQAKNLGIGAVLPLFRLLITGTGTGPSMFEIAQFLGKEECVYRLVSGINAVEALKTNT